MLPNRYQSAGIYPLLLQLLFAGGYLQSRFVAMPLSKRRPDAPSVDLGVTVTDTEETELAHLSKSKLFREYQEAFETSTGLPLVLRSPGSMRTPLQGSKQLNSFCSLMTQTNKTCAACLQLQHRVEQAATREPKTLQCYAGLSETALPIRSGDQLLGYMQTGQVFLRSPSKQRFQAVVKLLRAGGAVVDQRKLAKAYFRTRTLTRKQYQLILRLLSVFTKHLATVSNQEMLGNGTGEPVLVTRARQFIAEHHAENITLGDVAKAINSSRFSLSRTFKSATGLHFIDFLSRTRVESVKGLLHNPHTHSGEAGFAAGFQSLSQYNSSCCLT